MGSGLGVLGGRFLKFWVPDAGSFKVFTGVRVRQFMFMMLPCSPCIFPQYKPADVKPGILCWGV